MKLSENVNNGTLKKKKENRWFDFGSDLDDHEFLKDLLPLRDRAIFSICECTFKVIVRLVGKNTEGGFHSGNKTPNFNPDPSKIQVTMIQNPEQEKILDALCALLVQCNYCNLRINMSVSFLHQIGKIKPG